MNVDLGCVEFKLIEKSKKSNFSKNGIIIVSGDECYSALGMASGFTGEKPLNITKLYGLPDTWQFISLR